MAKRARKKSTPGKRKGRGSAARQATAAAVWTLPVLPKAVKKAMEACSEQEQQFVMAYCGKARGNAGLAAKLVGSSMSSHHTTYMRQGSIEMVKPHVRRAVEAWMDAFTSSAAQVTAQFADLAEANMGPFVQWENGELTIKCPDENEWEAHKHWIKEIDTDATTGKIIRLKLHDAMKANEVRARILKLYSDAPIVGLHLHVHDLSDEELLTRLQTLRGNIKTTHTTARLLPAAAADDVDEIAEVVDV